MKRFILAAIRFYQRYLSLDTGWIGRVLRILRLPFGVAQGGRSGLAICIFTPTCSEYTYQAVERYGIIYGLWLGLKRILRCHPWNKGGVDPVPTH